MSSMEPYFGGLEVLKVLRCTAWVHSKGDRESLVVFELARKRGNLISSRLLVAMAHQCVERSKSL